MTAPSTPATPSPGFDDRGSLRVEGQRFAVVPEWVIDAAISDCAFRLYSVLLRYGHTSGTRMPSRALLARRLRKNSTDTVDRAMKELVQVGAVRVEHRRDGGQNLTNRYHVRTAPPGRDVAATDATAADESAGRRPSIHAPGRTAAAAVDPTRAATPAAALRHDRELLTEGPPPAAPPSDQLLEACGIDDIAQLAEQCRVLRDRAAAPNGRWTADCLTAALQLAVTHRGWPATLAVPALLQVAADPATRSPMRLAEAGPWWDQAPPPAVPDPALDDLERRLAEVDGLRPLLQRRARLQLQAAGVPLTRRSVTEAAVALLDAGAETTGGVA